MLTVFELEDELIIKYNSELSGDGAERFSRRKSSGVTYLQNLIIQFFFNE